ncbi:MAG TPA: galactokinase family protein [Gaiellaceae bacterium]|nr:galactokinase family protein [Gaiellaceae bacterium]
MTDVTTVTAPLADMGDDVFPDADAFSARARRHSLFAPREPIVVARAPGRFDVLGGIADYAGGLVLGLPIRAAALAAAQAAGDGQVIAVSGARRIAIPAAVLVESPIADLARRFSGRDAWAAYVLGPVALLARDEGVRLPGLRLLLSSAVPEGKGLGSSAAVEVAAAQAVTGVLGLRLEPRRVALLAQRAEHLLAGAPCGVMDQMTVVRGEAGRLLTLICRPAEVTGMHALPGGLAVWGIDSGARHAVRAAPYRRARCACFMGKALLGVEAEYLSALGPRELEAERLPERMTGAEFLRVRDGVDDEMSSVEPEVDYPVRAATLHPIEEQERVETFLELLDGPVSSSRAQRLGAVMAASHAGYSRCGLGAPATDRIVEAVQSAGWEGGLIGARVSGGGSGGTVVVIGREEAEPAVRRVSELLGAGLVSGTSPGAASFGTRIA